MKNGTWLEVALNGPWSRQRQPRIPVSADEVVQAAVACAHEGAAIVHFHAYDAATGSQRDDYETYAPILERIRSQVDVICYGTLGYAADENGALKDTPRQRFATVEKLLQAGLMEWFVLDPGSMNLAEYEATERHKDGFVYANPESHIRWGLSLAQQHQATPSYAIYEPGFARLGAALHRASEQVPTPIYRFMFSQQFTFGFPPEDWALDAYLRLLHAEHPDAPWMVAGLGVDLGDLLRTAVRRGGHVRVGLEDAPLGCEHDNTALVKAARGEIDAAGGHLLNASQIRAQLKAL
jgi:3-keto-5-aminohexanoate cleavage enzyme